MCVGFHKVCFESLVLSLRGLVLLVVVFLCIIPLICCAPVLGREAQPCVSFSCRSGSAYVCAARQRESVGRFSLLFATAAAAVECPIQESWLCLIIIPFLIYIFSSFAAWFAALALWRLASGGRGAAARLALLCGFNFHWKRTLSIN